MRAAVVVAVVALFSAGCAGSDAEKERDVAPEVREGARLVAAAGCLQCHAYGELGSTNLGAPDLTRVGTRGRSARSYVTFLKCPRCLKPGALMPPYAGLRERNLRNVAAFLAPSDGTLVDVLEAAAARE